MTLLRCTLCKQDKPEECFTLVPGSKGRQGRHCHCKPCRVKYNSDYQKRNPEVVKQTKRGTHYRATYGITLGEYDKMNAYRGAGCWVCGKQGKTRGLSVDHDHKTGQIRGLLCQSCNRGLRWFSDDPARLREAATYLETCSQLMAAALDVIGVVTRKETQ